MNKESWLTFLNCQKSNTTLTVVILRLFCAVNRLPFYNLKRTVHHIILKVLRMLHLQLFRKLVPPPYWWSCLVYVYPGLSVYLSEIWEEILHWHFVDTWTGFVPWCTEEHTVLRIIASDASQSRWGAMLSLPNSIASVRVYFGQDMDEIDIATKEVHTLLCSLQAIVPCFTNTQVDAIIDNQDL